VQGGDPKAAAARQTAVSKGLCCTHWPLNRSAKAWKHALMDLMRARDAKRGARKLMIRACARLPCLVDRPGAPRQRGAGTGSGPGADARNNAVRDPPSTQTHSLRLAVTSSHNLVKLRVLRNLPYRDQVISVPPVNTVPPFA